tara:strand:- start:728 stop:1156 length:429 start_codon:yes stop_codon:yes gene_type:complete
MTNLTEASWPKSRWPNFSFNELACQETSDCEMNESTMDRLQALRSEYGRGLRISSGFRSALHSIEAKKKDPEGNPRPGAHATGRAIDIAVRGEDAYIVLSLATSLGFTGIGVSQKGDSRFLHLDDIQTADNFHAPRPSVWSY